MKLFLAVLVAFMATSASANVVPLDCSKAKLEAKISAGAATCEAARNAKWWERISVKFSRTPTVCIFGLERVVTSWLIFNVKLNEPALRGWFARAEMTQAYDACANGIGNMRSTRSPLHRLFFGRYSLSAMETELADLIRCVREATDEMCSEEEEPPVEDQPEGSAEEEEEGELLDPLEENDETDEETEAEIEAEINALGSGEGPTVNAADPDAECDDGLPVDRVSEPCLRECNYRDNDPTDVKDYEPLVLDATVDTLHGISDTYMGRLNAVGIVTVQDVICLHVRECRRFDRFDFQMEAYLVQTRWVKHIYKQVNEYCDAEDCDALCNPVVDSGNEGESEQCPINEEIEASLPANPPPYKYIGEAELEKATPFLWGIGRSTGNRIKPSGCKLVKDVICEYARECRTLDEFRTYMTGAGVAEDTVDNVYQQAYLYCAREDTDCKALCATSDGEGEGAETGPQLNCEKASALFERVKTAVSDCTPDDLGSGVRYFNSKFRRNAPNPFAKLYFHTCVLVQLKMAVVKDKRTLAFEKDEITSALGDESLFTSLMPAGINDGGMYEACDMVEGGISGFMNKFACMYNEQCEPAEEQICVE